MTMRMTVPLILAAALAASGPALAQDVNNTADANATDVAAMNATDASAAAPMAANDVAMAPEAAPPATTVDETAPEPEKKGGGFPWGVLGLLGLIGLIPRKSAR
jgi:hypothetical protein